MDNEAVAAVISQEMTKPNGDPDGGAAGSAEARKDNDGSMGRADSVESMSESNAEFDADHMNKTLQTPKILAGCGEDGEDKPADADDFIVLLRDADRIFNPAVVERLARFLGISGTPIIILLILYFTTDGGAGTVENQLSRVLGVGIGLLFTLYFVQLGNLFRIGFNKEDTYIFKVLTSSARVPLWTKMNVANNQLLYHYRPIQSISEFSAISGGTAGKILANIGPLSWVAVAVMFAAEMQCLNGVSFTFDLPKVLIVVGVCGIVMIGLFELDQFNHSMRIFHVIGTVMAAQILLAGLIQASQLDTAWLVIQILLSVLSVSALVTWQKLSTKERTKMIEDECAKDAVAGVDSLTREVKARITRESLKNVVSEGIAIYCVTLSLAVWLFNYGKYCDMGCVAREPSQCTNLCLDTFDYCLEAAEMNDTC